MKHESVVILPLQPRSEAMNQEKLAQEMFALCERYAAICADMALEGLELVFTQAEALGTQVREAVAAKAPEAPATPPEAPAPQRDFNPFYTPYKQGFEVWERHAARMGEVVLRSPLFLESM